jgi:hypothetical protein
VVETGALVEVATLEVAAILAKTEGPYGMEYCSDQTRGGAQAQIDIEATLDDSPVGCSCDLFADTTDGAVWEEGGAVEAGMGFHSRRTCWSCKVLVGCSKSLSTRTV